MTVRRQIVLSSVLITLLLATPVLAIDAVPTAAQPASSDPADYAPPLDLDIVYWLPEFNWIAEVTPTHIPRGSMHIEYDGPIKLLLKIADGQVSRFARSYYDHAPEDNARLLGINNDGGPTDNWWMRPWYDSLPSVKGGAPDNPYTNTYGREIKWHIGPFIISNTFRFKLRKVSALEFDADPQSPATKNDPDRPTKPNPVSINLEPDMTQSNGPNIKFKVRPSVSISAPNSAESWTSAIRHVSIKASIDIFIRGRAFIQAEIEASYVPVDEFSLTIGIVLGIW